MWTEELASGGRIELENFLVLEVQCIDRGEQRECGVLASHAGLFTGVLCALAGDCESGYIGCHRTNKLASAYTIEGIYAMRTV